MKAEQKQTGFRAGLRKFEDKVETVYANLDYRAQRVIKVFVTFALIVFFIFSFAYLATRYLVWTHIERYHKEIEQIAGRAMKNSVSIEKIRADWDGISPRLTFERISVQDKQKRQVLTLPEVSATISWWSLPKMSPFLSRLVITAPELHIKRDENGHFFVAGIAVNQEEKTESDEGGLDWVLSQREIRIENGMVFWQDELRKAPELSLKNVKLILRNNYWRRDRLYFSAAPPSEIAEPFTVRANFKHQSSAPRVSDFRYWKGELFADLPSTDLEKWKAYVDYPFFLERGHGSVRAWLDLDNMRVNDFIADIRLSDVKARLAKNTETLDLEFISGRVSVNEELNSTSEEKNAFAQFGHKFSFTDLTFKTKDGLYLPETTLSEEFVPNQEKIPEKIILKTPRLNLESIAIFGKYIPLPEDMRKNLADFAPRGEISNFSFSMLRDKGKILSLFLIGDFSDVSLNSGKILGSSYDIPKFSNLSGRIDANRLSGNITLKTEKSEFNLPQYFKESKITLSNVDIAARWAFSKEDVLSEVTFERLAFDWDETKASFTGKYKHKDKGGAIPGSIDIKGKATGFDISRVERFLPTNTPKTLYSWLAAALESGKAKDIVFRAKGDLADFPYKTKDQGDFFVTTKIENGKLNYDPTSFASDKKSPLWPKAEKIQGSLTVDGTRMEIRADTAQTLGVDLKDVSAIIPDLVADKPMLEISGTAAGAFQKFIQYTKESPVLGWIGGLTEKSTASGNTKLLLKFQMPLDDPETTKVQGTLNFENNDVKLLEDLPLLAQTKGVLQFNEKGFSINNLASVFLGGKTVINGGMKENGKFFVKANGKLTGSGLAKEYKFLSDKVGGSTDYSVYVTEGARTVEINVQSNMRGLTSTLPAPFAKTAETAMPLDAVLKDKSSGNAVADELNIKLGDVFAASYFRQKTAGGWKLVRGGIGVNAPLPHPDSGLSVKVKADEVDLTELIAMFSEKTENNPARKSDRRANAKNTDKSIMAASQEETSLFFNPYMVELTADKLLLGTSVFDKANVIATQKNDGWNFNLRSKQAAGNLHWKRKTETNKRRGQVSGRFSHLKITLPSRSESGGSGSILKDDKRPMGLPDLDILVDNFEASGLKLGSLAVNATNTPGLRGREWKINKLIFIVGDSVLFASGKWNREPNKNETSLKYELNMKTAGKLLDVLGYKNLLRGGKGKIHGNLSWKGSPYSLHISSLSGDVNLTIGKGQFQQIEPGVGRLLGVLSLQNLPKRLTFDFRDIFSKGFAFDTINATAKVNDGIMRTDNLKMLGAATTVLIDGSVDLTKETQDLRAVIIPDLSLGGAALATMILNPAIGVGAFLAQAILSDPLRKMMAYEYKISGSWAEPAIVKQSKVTREIPHSLESITKSDRTEKDEADGKAEDKTKSKTQTGDIYD